LGISNVGSYASGGSSVKVGWVFATNFPSQRRHLGQMMASTIEQGIQYRRRLGKPGVAVIRQPASYHDVMMVD
jgi:hypothetical protein